MFQDTFLIIKCDYLAKRKALLLHLLQRGFLIKGHRKINFSPELAAEFYQDLGEERCFMFQVILLSKGNSEAFILCKQNAVEDLLNTMVCYFGTSLEMEQNVHVTKCQPRVQREISFVFPNYVYEPIQCPVQVKFCINNPLVEATISSLYDIITKPEIEPHKSWKQKLAEMLALSNKNLPRISNQCSFNTNLLAHDMSQQTKITSIKQKKVLRGSERKSSFSDLDLSTDVGTSAAVTSSSCISCSPFSSSADCMAQAYQQQPYEDIIKARTAPLEVKESISSTKSGLEKDKLDEWDVKEFVGEEDTISLEKESIIHGDEIDNFVSIESFESVVSQPLAKEAAAVDVPDVTTHLVSVEDAEEKNKSTTELHSMVTREESPAKAESAVKEASSATAIRKDNNELKENVSMASEKNIVPNIEDIPESIPD